MWLLKLLFIVAKIHYNSLKLSTKTTKTKYQNYYIILLFLYFITSIPSSLLLLPPSHLFYSHYFLLRLKQALHCLSVRSARNDIKRQTRKL